MSELGPQERSLAINSLVCLVQSLEGKRTTIDLRNESFVFGTFEKVDAFMNVNMSNVVFINSKGEQHKFENFFIQARNIRYVHIPEEVSVTGAVERQLGKLVTPGRGKLSKVPDNSWKARKRIKQQKETLAMIEQIKQDRLRKEQVEKKSD